jgi:hypothetical protein
MTDGIFSRNLLVFAFFSPKYPTSTISNEERNLSLVFILIDLTARPLTDLLRKLRTRFEIDRLGFHNE